jgi:HK97 gp10 family phage protein
MTDVQFTEWNADKVREAAANLLFEHAPQTAKFIEDDARKRLEAITTPDTPRDKNYRWYLAKWILTSAVEKTGNDEFVIAVGMKIGKDGQRHHGFYIETGSSTAPAHPFLRPAVTQNARDIIRMLIGV